MDNNFMKYANSFQAVAKLRLESIRALTNLLGNPQNDLKFIHVAGTNGKGSVCAFLQNMLTLSGQKTGKYTSPNMIDVCERISIDGENISKEDMERILGLVRAAAERLPEMPTQFEIWTTAAFCYFKEQNCDIVVLETGLGGERDATNIIPAPEIAVITRIDADHKEYLGDSVSDIAAAKAGIIKRGLEVVTIAQNREAMAVIEEKCRAEGCPVTVAKEADSCGFDGIYEIFSYGGIENIRCALGGTAQTENAALAIECGKILGIEDAILRRGIESAENPGRFEIVRKDPLVIFDGAHNKNGMAALVNSLRRYFGGGEITFVTGVMADKDYGEMLEVLKTAGYKKLRAVRVKNNPRALEAKALAKAAREMGFCAAAYGSIRDALQNPDGITVICGSLYLYKDFKEM